MLIQKIELPQGSVVRRPGSDRWETLARPLILQGVRQQRGPVTDIVVFRAQGAPLTWTMIGH